MQSKKQQLNGEDLVVIGKIGKPYGVKGWISIWPFNPESDIFFDIKKCFFKKADSSWEGFVIKKIKSHKNHYVADIENIDDRDAAALLTNREISIFRKDLPILDNDEYYLDDLYGLKVINSDGSVLGEIKDFIETGANDVMVIDSLNKKEILIPFVLDEFIKNVDLEKKEIIVSWDEEDES